jgi:hypothetical protein
LSQILIDRDLLRRLLEQYFQWDIDNRAYRCLASRASILNPDAALQYGSLYESEVEAQRKQGAGSRRHLLDTLAAQDDDAFRKALSDSFPPG